MTLITGQVADVGMNNASGVFYARATEFRGDGTTVVSPSPATFTITGGVVSAEVAPGPTIITLHVGPVRNDWFVNVPETDVGLGDLIATYTEYEPAVVSAAIAARDAAIEAESEAKQAAIDAEAKRVAAEAAADLTGQDRLHVDNVRTLLDEAYDESQAGMALPPRLTETALNATYAPREGSAVYASKGEVASLIEVELDGSTVASVEPTPDALAKRTGSGSVRVPNPLGNLDAANRQWALAEIAGSIASAKEYVDNLLSVTDANMGMVLTVTDTGFGWRFPADSYQDTYSDIYA